MIKLVAFDWNGTLLADARVAAAGDIYAIGPFVKKPITFKKFQELFTIPIINYLKALGLSEKEYLKHHKEINSRFHQYYEARVGKTRTRSGAKASLEHLHKKKISVIIYSNHVKSDILRQLKRLRIEKYFATVLAREDGDISHMHTRGKVKKLSDYIKTKKFKPHEVVSVGDTEEEIETGKTHGYKTVAITGGYNTTARLKKHKPDFLIHNMLELKKIIGSLNSKKWP